MKLTEKEAALEAILFTMGGSSGNETTGRSNW